MINAYDFCVDNPNQIRSVYNGWTNTIKQDKSIELLGLPTQETVVVDDLLLVWTQSNWKNLINIHKFRPFEQYKDQMVPQNNKVVNINRDRELEKLGIVHRL